MLLITTIKSKFFSHGSTNSTNAEVGCRRQKTTVGTLSEKEVPEGKQGERKRKLVLPNRKAVAVK